jgi:hypothetical protein
MSGCGLRSRRRCDTSSLYGVVQTASPEGNQIRIATINKTQPSA